MHDHHDHGMTTPVCYAAGSLWWFAQLLYANAPPWSLVPPLLFGVVALLNATNTFLNGRHARKIAETEAARCPSPSPTATSR